MQSVKNGWGFSFHGGLLRMIPASELVVLFGAKVPVLFAHCIAPLTTTYMPF